MTPTPLTTAQVAETIGNINGFITQLNNLQIDNTTAERILSGIHEVFARENINN